MAQYTPTSLSGHVRCQLPEYAPGSYNLGVTNIHGQATNKMRKKYSARGEPSLVLTPPPPPPLLDDDDDDADAPLLLLLLLLLLMMMLLAIDAADAPLLLLVACELTRLKKISIS
jgi:hypothetical protein